MGSNTNRYRFIGSVGDVQIDQVQVGDTDKVLRLHDPASGRYGNVEALTDKQANEIRQHAVLEVVPEDAPDEHVFQNEGGDGEAALPAEAPDVDKLGFRDLQKLAKERSIEGYGDKNEDDLRELVRNDIQAKGV